jgi:hypothetical protein
VAQAWILHRSPVVARLDASKVEQVPRAWTTRESNDGVQLEDLHDGATLVARTHHSTYEVAIVSARTGDALVRGGAYFPEPTPCVFAGSSLHGSFLKLRGVYLGFHMEFHVGARRIITSAVESISVTMQPAAY